MDKRIAEKIESLKASAATQMLYEMDRLRAIERAIERYSPPVSHIGSYGKDVYLDTEFCTVQYMTNIFGSVKKDFNEYTGKFTVSFIDTAHDNVRFILIKEATNGCQVMEIEVTETVTRKKYVPTGNCGSFLEEEKHATDGNQVPSPGDGPVDTVAITALAIQDS